MFPHIKTDTSLTVVVENKPYSITTSHPNYNELLQIARDCDPEEFTEVFYELFEPKRKFENIFGSSDNGFFLDGAQIKCKVAGYDFPIPSSLGEEIIDIYESNSNLAPLANFVFKLSNNPRKEVVDELWDFIRSCGLAITESGDFLAYKNVRENFKSIHDGSTDNSPGTVLSMPRWQVEHNPSRTCSAGLHFAAWGYLSSYSVGGKTVILSVSPEDVVSIPSDYNNMKGRACRYKVLREVEQPEELKEHKVYTDSGYPNIVGNDWIKHTGDETVPPKYYGLEVLLSDGSRILGTADEFCWELGLGKYSIKAYRLDTSIEEDIADYFDDDFTDDFPDYDDEDYYI